MRVSRLPILSLVALALGLPATQQPPARPPDLVRTFLHDKMGFDAGEIADVASGRAVARQMKAREAVDVDIFGAVNITGTVDAFVQQLRGIDAFEKKLGIHQAAKFHDPPLLADLDGLTLDPDDAGGLEDCRPADCGLQLPASAMTRFREQIDWRAGNVAARVDPLFRRVLFEQLQKYQAGGHIALDPYDDRDHPIAIAHDFRLLAAPGDTPVEVPALTHYLRTYPRATLPNAEEFFYWNKGEFGLKPTVRVSHVVIYPLAGGGWPDNARYIVATSQVYANHYFSATLELRTIVDDPAQPGKRFYLLYTTKSRVSGLTGFMGTLMRPLVKSRARSGMERYLEATKRVAEGR